MPGGRAARPAHAHVQEARYLDPNEAEQQDAAGAPPGAFEGVLVQLLLECGGKPVEDLPSDLVVRLDLRPWDNDTALSGAAL